MAVQSAGGYPDDTGIKEAAGTGGWKDVSAGDVANAAYAGRKVKDFAGRAKGMGQKGRADGPVPASRKAQAGDDAEGFSEGSTAKKAGTAVGSTVKGAKAYGMAQSFMMAKNFFAGGAAGAAQAAGSVFAAAGSAVTSAVSSVVMGLNAVEAAVVAAVLASAITMTAVIGGGVAASISARSDGLVDNCTEAKKKSSVGMEEGEAMAAGEKQKEVFKQIYSIVKAYGGTLEQAAGILGCWMVESSCDPTAVETVFTEPYTIGPRKQLAIDSDFSPSALDASYAAAYPKIVRLGIGFGQWTDTTDGAVRNSAMRAYAESVGGHWYDAGVQFGFMLSTDQGAPAMKQYLDTMKDSSVNECVEWFLAHWEGVPGNKLAQRQSYAGSIAVTLASMEPDIEYGKSILAYAEVTGGEAVAVSASASVCKSGSMTATGDNSSLAAAGVSLAYETQAEGNGNNGTELYQRVHDAVLQVSSGIYMSCDRGVATAVRWAGYDDTFCEGPTSSQYEYLKNSPKWEEVTEYHGSNLEVLQPGDVMITRGNGHVALYVGNEAVRAKYPNSTADLVSASYMERSPGCGYAAYEFAGAYGDSYVAAFRNVQKEADSIYKDVASGDR